MVTSQQTRADLWQRGILAHMRFTVVPMTLDDWPRVAEIYAAGITTGQATFETVVPSWGEWDDRHLPYARLVAREGAEIVGWAALSPVSSRPVYAGVAEVSVYVDPASRGEGVGTILLGALIEGSESGGVWTLQSSVFRENGATLALHRRHGFREVGYRERIGRHHDTWRDTVLLERRSREAGGG